jgi:hypothetical protein
MIGDVLTKAGEAAVKHVKEESRFKRRKKSPRSLKDATRYRVKMTRNVARLIVRSNKRYAPFVEFSTRPHPIVAKRAKALRFRGRSGAFVFRKRVFHPGTTGTKFLSNAVRHAGVVVAELIRHRMRKAKFKF